MPTPDPPRIHLLHAPRLRLPDGSQAPLERKDAALLAMLALDGPTAPAAAANRLWPDTDEAQARANLRQRLFRLRRKAGCELVLSDGALRLAPEVAVDTHAAPQAWRDDPAAAAGELLGALDYGDQDALDDWARGARERWRQFRRDQIAGLASEAEAAGRIADALRLAERLLADEPLMEHALRRVMRLHYRRGDLPAALSAYERFTRRLADEIGEHPGTETESLRAAILAGSEAAPPPVEAPVPEVLRRPPRRAGDDAGWRLLHAAWNAGRPVLVLGEAGIGKSRLLGDFATAAGASGGEVCLQAGRAGDDRAPYALALRLLADLQARRGPPPIAEHDRRALGLLAAPAGSAPPPREPLEPARLRVAVEQALRHWQRGGLAGIVIDDLHFADAASIELLLAVAGAPEAGLRWVLASRPATLPATVSAWAEQLGPQALDTLRLAPLDAGGVAALLASLALPGLDPAAWADRLLDHAGGNPLLLLATLTDWHIAHPGGFGPPPAQLPAPRALDEALRARLQRLSPLARQLAQVAGVAQQDFGAEMAAAVLECRLLELAAPWRELEDANVLAGTRFSHDLMRDAVAAGLPPALSAALHRRIARWLADHGAAPGREAEHWWACAAWPEAAQALDRAAREAARLSRRQDEAALLRRAAQAHEQAGDAAAAFDARCRVVHATLVAEPIEAALAAAELLLAGARTPAQRIAALEARAAVHNERTDAQRALDDVAGARAQALALPQGAPAPAMQVALARREAMALMWLNRNPQALAVLGAVRDAALSLPDETQRLAWRIDFASALDYNDRLEDAAAANREVAAEAEAAQHWTDAANALGNLAVTECYLGRLEDARAHGEQAIRIGRRLGGEDSSVLIDEMTLAGTLRDLGHFDDAMALGERVAEAMRRGGHANWAVNAEHDLCGLYLWLGRADLAAKALRPLADDMPAWTRGGRLLVEARLDRLNGKPVRDKVERAAEFLAGVGRSYVRLKVELERARCAPPAERAEHAAGLYERATRCEQHALAGQAVALQVDSLRGAGPDTAPRAPLLDAARRLLAHLQRHDPFGVYRAEPWWIACQALHAAGDRRAAQAALREALGWLRGTALPHVPALFRDSFLIRNPVNAGLLQAESSGLPDSRIAAR